METKLIDSKNVISAAINAVAESDNEVYLFLDDYHAVTDTRSHELTEFLLRYAPSNFHLVVMSRTEPPLPVSRLRLADELAELDVANLRFTLSETEQFLSAEQMPKLATAQISKLYDATEEADQKILDALENISKARGIAPAQIALAWLLHQKGMVAPIVGASKPHHLEDAIASAAGTLSACAIAPASGRRARVSAGATRAWVGSITPAATPSWSPRRGCTWPCGGRSTWGTLPC